MVDRKKVADLITGGRALLGVGYVWLGLARGAAGLPLAGWLLIVNWTGDSLDGAIARRQTPFYQTWIGERDLEVDMLVAAGLLAFLVAAGLAPVVWAGVYVAVWLALFAALGVPRSLGMLVQAPVYGWFIATALREAPLVGWSMIVWIVAALVVTWPRFPQEIVPGFLGGLRALREGGRPAWRRPRSE